MTTMTCQPTNLTSVRGTFETHCLSVQVVEEAVFSYQPNSNYSRNPLSALNSSDCFDCLNGKNNHINESEKFFYCSRYGLF